MLYILILAANFNKLLIDQSKCLILIIGIYHQSILMEHSFLKEYLLIKRIFDMENRRVSHVTNGYLLVRILLNYLENEVYSFMVP